MSSVFQGFIVNAYTRTRHGKTLLYFIGRLEDGTSFAIAEDRFKPYFYIRRSERDRAGDLAELDDALWEDCQMVTMDGEPCLKLSWQTQERRKQAEEAVAAAQLRSYEADLRLTDLYRMERIIHGPVLIKGEPKQGRRVDRVFVNPELEAGTWDPDLSLLSLDIETDTRTSEVLAISLSLADPFQQAMRNKVLFVGPELDQEDIDSFTDEAAMLAAFRYWLQELDPDIITGWNVIDFDFKVLVERFKKHGLPLDWGRADDAAVYLGRSEQRTRFSSRMLIPGRQIWDGVRLVRASPERYEDYSLETVAAAVLGYGKEIDIDEGERKVDAIRRLYRENPLDLCRYCLRDAQLVHEIFARTGLFRLTLSRCLLIGVAPDRVWTSIPAFEQLYIENMHVHGVAAPTMGVDSLPLEGAPGGIILTPQPGVYDEVLVFDFQSLYPSIIRSFNIDPLSYVPRAKVDYLNDKEREQLIQAPNGACFQREPAILPELLDRFFENRALAKEKGDKIASFVYKIIMNSFYGVLGAPGCRFAGSDLAGAITSMGQHILAWCKTLLEEQGLRVLYGDTDSLFVTRLGDQGPHPEPESICRQVNAALTDYLSAAFGVCSLLNLEFEKRYSRFFLPPLRGAQGEGARPEREQRGRAKGYAGLLSGLGEVHSRIEIKGMEAVRRDWTDLAHEFQIGLLELLFDKQPLELVQSFIKDTLQRLQAGALDEKLIYRKNLRKPISTYTRNRPPHVKAAELLDPRDQRGLIRYYLTEEGPQPETRRSASIDYRHYVDKQLKPIAAAFADVFEADLGRLFGEERQLLLF